MGKVFDKVWKFRDDLSRISDIDRESHKIFWTKLQEIWLSLECKTFILRISHSELFGDFWIKLFVSPK